MFYLNLKGYLLTWFIFCRSSFVQSEYLYKQTVIPNTPSITQTIKQDMQLAFSSITNNTEVFRKMYDFETSNTDISTLLFKLPNSEESPETETLMLMNRREFMAPTFPNLTQTYMILRRFKISKTPINSNITELLKMDTDSILQDYANDAWSDMGLHGWKGAIADPKVPPNHKYPTAIANDYPHADITKDLNNGQYLSSAIVEKTEEEEELQKDMDKQVFIARANDPFGYSTKWQTRNTSMQPKYKRDAVRLYSMIKCSTGCEPLVYKGYGCYCGFLGNGSPIDGIDRCCKLHDKCYQQSNCISFLEYFVPYIWKCYRGKPLCAIDHGEWGGPQSCAARLCHCDLRLSRCLRQYVCPGNREVCRSSASRRLQNLLLTQ